MILVSKVLPKKGSLLLLNAVVSKQNIHELPSLTKFANKMGFCVGFVPVLLSEEKDHKYSYRDYAPKLSFRKQDSPIIEDSYNKLIKMKKQGYCISNSDVSLKDSITFLKKDYRWQCDAGKLYFMVDYDGSFLPCTELSSVGSIFEKDFTEKFYSKKFQQTMLEKIKSCPNCMHPCYREKGF